MMELLKSINKNNELYTKYNDRFYVIQEYIEEWKRLKKPELRKEIEKDLLKIKSF